MKASWKVSLVAVMAGALVLVLILGASISSAAAPDAQLADDLVFVGNGKGTAATGNDVKVVDIDAMAVVNTIGGGGLLANNHGVLVSSDGKSLWNTNAALASGNNRVVKLDLGTLAQTTFDGASADQYALSLGLCGIEYDPLTGKMWAESMSTGTGNGGSYEIDPATGFTGNFVDMSAGADNGQTCGIGWNTSGSLAYASLMTAKKTNEVSWPAGTLTGNTTIESTPLHILDIAASAQYGYVAAGKDGVGAGYLDVIDLTTMTLVNHMLVANPSEPHGPTIAHNEGFLYLHSRAGSGGTYPGTLYIYDIGGGSGGGTKAAPVLIGQIADQGTPAVSCGTDVVAKSDYCSQPSLGLSKTAVYWYNWTEYTAKILSVNYSVNNNSALAGAHNVQIVASASTNGVTVNTTLPVSLGNIGGGGSAATTLKYNIPVGVTNFMTTTYASAKDLCNNSYAYPGAPPVP